MAADSKIEWTYHTFNPWLGCSKVHSGCTNCYAEVNQGVVMRKGGRVQWGEVWQGGQRVVTSNSYWRQPYTWARAAAKAGARRRVFCSSLADVLEVPEGVPAIRGGDEAILRVTGAREALDGARERLWDTIRQTARVCGECGGQEAHHVQRGYCAGKRHDGPRRLGGLDWLLLTKRPERWRLVPEDVRSLVWLGTSVSDQKTVDEWVPRLLAAEGFRYRFLSVEPLVGPVDLRTLWRHGGFTKALIGERITSSSTGPVVAQSFGTKLDWVIVGGESGPKARPCDVAWVRDIVRQCREAGVPCFVKQLGRRPVAQHPMDVTALVETPLADSHGGDMSEWPEDLRVRELPGGQS